MVNDLVVSFFAKDPLKQNITEKECEKWIGVKKLPANGKNSIRFDSEGNIVSERIADTSKSADFLVEGIYFTQKYIGNSSGGAQDNQYNDVANFLSYGSINHKVGAIVDGNYWDELGNRKILIDAFKDNKNVIILSADDIKGGKIVGKN